LRPQGLRPRARASTCPALATPLNIPIKSEFKYLGITFQRNGTYHKHTQALQDKCAKRLNLLRAVKGTTWGVAKVPMLSLYRSLI